MKESKKAILSGVSDVVSSHFKDRNTVEYLTRDGKRIIHFHHTDILIFSGDSVRISSGGWRTITTKERINKFLPDGLRLGSMGGFWAISSRNGGSFTFKDGMVFDGLHCVDSTRTNADYKKYLVFKKAVNKYVDNYCKLLFSGKMELPGAGDCFICHFSSSSDYCIFSHIKENYLVPSLIWNAMQKDTYYLPYIKQLQTGDISKILFKKEIRRIFRKFLLSKLSPEAYLEYSR